VWNTKEVRVTHRRWKIDRKGGLSAVTTHLTGLFRLGKVTDGFGAPEHGENPWRTRRCNRRAD
jgi:hypothetical protein